MRIPKRMTFQGKWTNERIARTAFYIIVGMAAVVFLLFFLVGFSKPYSLDPHFKDPKFTPLVLGFVAIVVVVAVVAAIWAVTVSLCRKGKTERVTNGVPVGRIALTVVVVTSLVMIVTFIAGSSETIEVNGKTFTNALMLRGADMFVCSSVIMLLMAAAAAFYGMYHSHEVDKQ